MNKRQLKKERKLKFEIHQDNISKSHQEQESKKAQKVPRFKESIDMFSPPVFNNYAGAVADINGSFIRSKNGAYTYIESENYDEQ